MELKRLQTGRKFLLKIQLLIVPYGIETAVLIFYVKIIHAFNRTLWN